MRDRTLLSVAVLLASTMSLASAAAVHAAQPPARDRVTVQPAGSGSIEGTVVVDGPEPRPARRARVIIASPDLPMRASVITDDGGNFRAAGLPAGRFTLSVVKEAFVTTAYGARRPGRPGTSIVLGAGEQVKGLTIRLPRGAVITGQVTDGAGQPATGAQVRAMRHVFGTDGRRTLVPVGAAAMTDDRGLYRIYGLPPGSYTVGASVPRDAFASSTDLQVTTEAEMKATRNAFAGGSAAAPGQLAAVDLPRPQTVSFAPVYHPGTTRVEDAAVLTLSAGEERAGIDLQIVLAPTARVAGTLNAPEGIQTNLVVVNLIATGGAAPPFMGQGFRATRPGPDGRFEFTSVAPGSYAIVARAVAQKDKPSAGPSLWAMTELDVQGADVSNITLQIQEGLSVEGRIVLDATSAAAPADLSGFRVALESAALPSQVNLGTTPVQSDATGAFRLAGVTPGRYRINVQPSRGLSPAWGIRSALLDTRDVALQAFDIGPGQQVGSVAVTFTDRPTEIRGTLHDAAGIPSSDYFIIVFPADPALRANETPRVRAVRPARDGTYRVRIPAGEYLLVALTDVEDNEWRDPAFLDRLSGSAMRFTLADGEQKVQDLRLGAGS